MSSIMNNSNNLDHDSVNIPIEMDKIKIIEPNESGRMRTRRGSVSPIRARRDITSAANDAEQHLLNKRPPVAKPELADDDDELDIDDPKIPQPGVDDGFFTGETDEIPNPENGSRPTNGIGPRRRPSNTPSIFPYAPGYGPRGTVNINGVDTPVPDVNIYQQKKTLAQGMMDLALFSANANQLRYVLESHGSHQYFYPSVIFISLSLFCQVAIGIGLLLNSRYDVNSRLQICKANRINNFTVIGIFIVTVVNVFISAFGVADTAPPQPLESSG